MAEIQFRQRSRTRPVAVQLRLPTLSIDFLLTERNGGAISARYLVAIGLDLHKYIFIAHVTQEYLDIYAHGFYQLPTPAQVRATSPDKLTVEELRHEFQHYAQRKVAPELSGFYGAVLDRDEVQDYFERQAVTMHIMDHYVREGAPLAVGRFSPFRARSCRAENVQPSVQPR